MSLHWVGPDGTIIWANRDELNVLGYDAREYIGRNITDFHADPEVIQDILTRLTKNETLLDYPARLKHKDGSIIHVLINSSVYSDDHGRFIHTRCFTRNVTAAKLAETERQKQEAIAREQEAREQAIRFENLSKRLERERQMNLSLLHQMLPPKVAADLSAGRPVPAEAFDSVTIFFSDIEGFTKISAAVEPMAVVHLLNRLYTVMDHCASLFPVYKVETIGDAYMVVGGLPQPTATHPADVADFALLVREAVALVPNPLPPAAGAPPAPVRVRIGLHCGPAVAGVVGNLMPRYCLFGDTVNTASRMESSGEAGRIHCSAPLAAALRAGGAHALAPRDGGPVDVRGKGPMETYWLLAADDGNARAGPAAVAEALACARALLARMPESGLYAAVLREDDAGGAGAGGVGIGGA